MEEKVFSEQVVNEIKAGRKIKAIKLLRAEQGVGLKKAKEMIEAYMQDHAEVKEAFEENQETGFSQERVLQLLVVIILLLIGYYFYHQS